MERTREWRTSSRRREVEEGEKSHEGRHGKSVEEKHRGNVCDV